MGVPRSSLSFHHRDVSYLPRVRLKSFELLTELRFRFRKPENLKPLARRWPHPTEPTLNPGNIISVAAGGARSARHLLLLSDFTVIERRIRRLRVAGKQSN
ncbi:3-isopropylmalate dehydrogenase [Anopheles sinensis]|uniref:3-isopropylmalate dehydrogenase n=1 Tax=Anopheles sinensis TaxID=74873 RepID=A0A084WCF4_ANOSI|nr:3-isopropylmalate dehydrogenase [Anopheles sinensis]